MTVTWDSEKHYEFGKEILAFVDLTLQLSTNVGIIQIPCSLNLGM